MIAKIAGQASRYLQTYWILLADFARDRGWRFLAMAGLIVAAAVVYPLPFVLIASLFLSAEHGAGFELDLRLFKISAGLDVALPWLMLFAACVFALNYLVGRLVNAQTVAWQNGMLWRIVSAVPTIARWDQVIELGTVGEARPLAVRIQQVLRGGFLIGRLVDAGLRDAIVVLVCIVVMLVLDAKSVLLILIVTLIALPIYATLLAGLATERARRQKADQAHLRAVTGLIASDLGARPARRLEVSRLPPELIEAGRDAVGFLSLQMNRIIGMNLIAGLHALAALAAVYLGDGARLAAMAPQKLVVFIVLLLLLRSVLSLVGLISRLTRGYQGLALLRSLLRPLSKRGAIEHGGGFSLVPASGECSAMPLPMGTILYLAAPSLHSSLHLLPLANALNPLFDRTRYGVRHIPFVDACDLPALATGTIAESAPAPVMFGEGRKAITIALDSDPLELAQIPVLALTAVAHAALAQSGQLEPLRVGRVLVVAAGPELPADPMALLAVSDGSRIVHVGPAAVTAERYSDELRRWRKRIERREASDNEIEDDET